MSDGAEGPLAGILAVSVEQAVAAPFATMRLADAGARVIKVERPEGDFARYYDRHVGGECAWFVWLNRGKESVVLDIKDAGDNALLGDTWLRITVGYRRIDGRWRVVHEHISVPWDPMTGQMVPITDSDV